MHQARNCHWQSISLKEQFDILQFFESFGDANKLMSHDVKLKCQSVKNFIILGLVGLFCKIEIYQLSHGFNSDTSTGF